MFKVSYGQDPYSVIGKYIRDHITVVEDIIAVIKIDDVTTNQLFMVDMDEEDFFIWKTDWYEGEKDVALIDFFPVSEAINPSVQPEPCGDVVSRNAIVQKLNEMDRYVSTELRLCDTDKKFPQNEVFIVDDVYEEIVEQLPSAQPERTAKWIVTTSMQEGQITWRDYKCSNCSHHREKPMNFCEVCGRKMERG